MEPRHAPDAAGPAPTRPPGRLDRFVSRVPPWVWPVGLGVLGLAGAVVLHLFDPSQDDTPYPTCPFLFLTGLQCPGCGTTRALALLTHGDLVAAASMNPLTVLVLPFLLLVYARWLVGTLRRNGPPLRPEPHVPTWAMIAVLAGIVAFWILRNLPWFSVLAAGTPPLPS
ncbi:DUF2752 domain-containing protein [Nocardiopsis sp. HNM0947]|uniref:DUF2752 domain-containing protein n=1 Tax=Nocardiopsis coralli TaxID=2772213 RepID=A0ABR9P0K4_9ACTN|nr:DUF2752 domain-containing protein [Nocardiopsis coralli]MBE2997305.1 DUF2752 domain-containing protein [Nocardiopsis coralli]